MTVEDLWRQSGWEDAGYWGEIPWAITCMWYAAAIKQIKEGL